MTAIGETLRAERLRRNLGIQEISRELKIPARFLEAIEQEQFDKLPAAVFARSFVRQYARALGLHEDEMADALQRSLDPPQAAVERASGKPVPPPAIQVDPMAEWERVGERRAWSSSLPALAMVVVVMLGCSGVYAWWQRSRRTASTQDAASTANPASQALPAAPSAVPPPPATQIPAPSAAQQVAPAPSAIQPVSTAARAEPSAQRPAGNPPPAPGAQATQPAAAATPDPPRAPGPVHVEITASELVWVFAKADGKTAFTGTLEANQSRTVDANGEVVLRLGNAGGAHITLNGKSVGEVGPRGQPRTVQLTSGGFQIVAPPKPDLLLDPLR